MGHNVKSQGHESQKTSTGVDRCTLVSAGFSSSFVCNYLQVDVSTGANAEKCF